MDLQVKQAGTLYVVATPIGNLGDITLRALEILKSVDAIAAEDTRHTSGLLSHFGISKKLIAVHEHNEQQSTEKLVLALKNGENIALVTDAGTPAVSDPGAIVVKIVREAGMKVVPIPGASAVVTALSASGITQNGFYFHGFLPASGAARRKMLENLKLQTEILPKFWVVNVTLPLRENSPRHLKRFIPALRAAPVLGCRPIKISSGVSLYC